MRKYKEIKDVHLVSICYVHDPKATERWFEMCMEMALKKFEMKK